MRYQQDSYLFVIRPDGSLRYCRPAEWRQIRAGSLTLDRLLGADCTGMNVRALRVSLADDGEQNPPGGASRALQIDRFCLIFDQNGVMVGREPIARGCTHRARGDLSNWYRELEGAAHLEALPPAAGMPEALLQDYIGDMLAADLVAHSAAVPGEPLFGTSPPLGCAVAAGAEKWQQTDAFADELGSARRACA